MVRSPAVRRRLRRRIRPWAILGQTRRRGCLLARPFRSLGLPPTCFLVFTRPPWILFNFALDSATRVEVCIYANRRTALNKSMEKHLIATREALTRIYRRVGPGLQIEANLGNAACAEALKSIEYTLEAIGKALPERE